MEDPMEREDRIQIGSEHDILTARQRGRELAAEAGITGSDLTVVATAISEIARNIVEYAGRGEMVFKLVEDGQGTGLLVEARDQGPGIPDVGLAMQDGYSTGRSLGLGLPGARRLMDEFDIDSLEGKGTTITMTKWVHRRSARVGG
jgi:serine/threonine-protein kinase RsbT